MWLIYSQCNLNLTGEIKMLVICGSGVHLSLPRPEVVHTPVSKTAELSTVRLELLSVPYQYWNSHLAPTTLENDERCALLRLATSSSSAKRGIAQSVPKRMTVES